MSVTYQQAREALEGQLSPAGVAHSARVADTASRLAGVYGVDETEARIAGLLHDWHRETPHEELLRRARALGIEVTDVDEAVPYLLHGPVAEAELRSELPGLSDEVLQAIGGHTYGPTPVTPLAMVVYVADTIEPSRAHDGVEELRSAVGVLPLPELFAQTYASSLRHLVDSRRRIHPHTVATWNRIVAESSR